MKITINALGGVGLECEGVFKSLNLTRSRDLLAALASAGPGEHHAILRAAWEN